MIKFLIALLVMGIYGAIPFILDGYLNPESGKNSFPMTFLELKQIQNQIIRESRLIEGKKPFCPNFTSLSIIITTRNNLSSLIKTSYGRFTLYFIHPCIQDFGMIY